MPSTDAAAHLERFNAVFVEFLDDLTHLFPGDSELGLMQLAVRAASVATPTLLQSGFHEFVAEPFGDRVLDRDEAFFLAKDDYDQHVSDATVDIAALVQKIKAGYGRAASEDRAAVWRYLRTLVLLSRKVEATK